MDFTNVEVAAIEKIADQQSDIAELNDLQLAAVGGGCGEVVFG